MKGFDNPFYICVNSLKHEIAYHCNSCAFCTRFGNYSNGQQAIKKPKKSELQNELLQQKKEVSLYETGTTYLLQIPRTY